MSSNPTIGCAPGGSSSGGGGGGGAGGGGGGGGGPCGACKFLRRKCVEGCIFAPYFDSEQGSAHFAAVHKVFGASNVSKMLQHVPLPKRLDAVVTICYEAQARLRNPVYGCVAHIFALQQQVVNLQGEISYLQAHLANLELQTPPVQPPAPPPHNPLPHFSISDLPTASAMPPTFDVSSLLFDPVTQWPQLQPMHPQHHQQASDLNNPNTRDQYVTLAIPHPSSDGAQNLAPGGAAGTSGSGGGDAQGLARELLLRHGSSYRASGASSSGAVHGSCSEAQRPSGGQPK
uniref:LOB domain-containing protein n=1 Tax=Kalanchoe fedtschenkoi TaxID=63787 RepID=A0A7N0T0G2_KALFE